MVYTIDVRHIIVIRGILLEIHGCSVSPVSRRTFCSSSSLLTCLPLRTKTEAADTMIIEPLNMRARRIFNGGSASGPARNAPSAIQKV